MNRLRIFLITSALLACSSMLASAQDFRHHDADDNRYRVNNKYQGRDRGWYGYGDGDHDRDDRYVFQDGRYGTYGRPVYRDRDWRDNDDRRVYQHRDGDRDHDRR
jgi:hypothetical protein